MAERTVELDRPETQKDGADAIREATDRAERAEAELAKLKAQQRENPSAESPHAQKERQETDTEALKQPPSPSTAANAPDGYGTTAVGEKGSANRATAEGDGEEELRKDPMMAGLLDALDAGTDVGHYGRLVFAMVARHFLPHDQVVGWLTKDRDFSTDQAQQMLHQVEGRDYSPPRRERLLEWQREQEFQFLDPADPDSGNLYRNLTFPQEIYENIGHYQEAKAAS